MDLDQDLTNEQNNSFIEIDVWMDDELQTSLVIGELCSLHQLGQDLIAEDEIELT